MKDTSHCETWWGLSFVLHLLIIPPFSVLVTWQSMLYWFLQLNLSTLPLLYSSSNIVSYFVYLASKTQKIIASNIYINKLRNFKVSTTARGCFDLEEECFPTWDSKTECLYWYSFFQVDEWIEKSQWANLPDDYGVSWKDLRTAWLVYRLQW